MKLLTYDKKNIEYPDNLIYYSVFLSNLPNYDETVELNNKSCSLIIMTNIIYFLKGTILSSLISSVLVGVSLKSYVYNFFFTAKNFLLNVLDYMRILKRVVIRNGFPIQIIHYVTSRCNLRCHHCFYKETLDKKDPGEQELQIFKKTSKQIGPVLWYALAGGEVFIIKDIVKSTGSF